MFFGVFLPLKVVSVECRVYSLTKRTSCDSQTTGTLTPNGSRLLAILNVIHNRQRQPTMNVRHYNKQSIVNCTNWTDAPQMTEHLGCIYHGYIEVIIIGNGCCWFTITHGPLRYSDEAHSERVTATERQSDVTKKNQNRPKKFHQKTILSILCFR